MSLFSTKLLLFSTTINPASLSVAGQCLLSKVRTEEPWRQKKERLRNFISRSAIHIIRWRNSETHEKKSCGVHGSCFHLWHLCCWSDPFSFHLLRLQIEGITYILCDMNNGYKKWIITILMVKVLSITLFWPVPWTRTRTVQVVSWSLQVFRRGRKLISWR